MKTTLLIVQIVISVAITALILLQVKGAGLGRAWGGAGEFYKSRRGVEKIVFNATIALAALFLVTSILNVVLS